MPFSDQEERERPGSGSGETIAAIATPPGEGALAVIRISGGEALRVADSMFRGTRKPSVADERYATLGRVVARDGEVLDEVLLTVFRGPRSYTGEDLVEISGHGGGVVAARVLSAALAAGARLARPGEFTERAFLNGKLDLTQAEAVMDLISAQTPKAARAAAGQLGGALGREIAGVRGELLEAVAHLEAHIDFPEEGIDPENGAVLCRRILSVDGCLQRLMATAREGRLLREGITLALCGAPNAGKSSLLNRLLGTERAIVSPVPGTTRDTIEETASLGGYPFRIIDTAGLRETEDLLEREGVERARRAAEEADLRIHLVDASAPGGARAQLFPDELLVLNKADLLPRDGNRPHDGPPLISCRTGEGLDRLVALIVERVAESASAEGPVGALAINERHQDCLRRGSSALQAALALLESGEPLELVAVELRSALDCVGEIVGGAGTEEILGQIFSRFCIGK